MAKKRRSSILAKLIAFVIILQTMAGFTTQVYAEDNISTDPIFNPDYSELIGRSDITHTGRISDGKLGYTIASGSLGGPVWESATNTLTMQVNHTDVFRYNDASANSAGDYCGAVGRINIGFGGNVFGNDTYHHMSQYNGRLLVQGTDVEVEVRANMYDRENNVVAIHITDNRAVPQPITVDLTSLDSGMGSTGEYTSVKTRNADLANGFLGNTHTLYSKLGDEGDNVVSIYQSFKEPSDTGIPQNDYFNHSSLAMRVGGREVTNNGLVTASSRYRQRLTVPAQSGSFTVYIGGDASMKADVDVKQNAINSVNSPVTADYEGFVDASQSWWNDYWTRSYTYLPSMTHWEQRRNYNMYLAAVSSGGDYPQKYNGGIWHSEERYAGSWADYYWGWNVDPVFQPQIDSNNLYMMNSLFKFRESAYDNYKNGAKQWFGAEGIWVPETSGVLGAEWLSEDFSDYVVKRYTTFPAIAESSALLAFRNRRNGYLTPLSGSGGTTGWAPAGWVSHSLVKTLETAEYFWQAYTYTKDIADLERAWPFIEGAADLIRTWFGTWKDETTGRWNIDRTHVHEHIIAGRNSMGTVSLSKGVLEVAAYAAELLHEKGKLDTIDPEKIALWREISEGLEFPLRTDPGAVWGGTLVSYGRTDLQAWMIAESNKLGNNAFAQGTTPHNGIRDVNGEESPILNMVEKFDVLTLESSLQDPNDPVDGEKWAEALVNWERAINTFRTAPGYWHGCLPFGSGTGNNRQNRTDQNGSSRYHINAAELGLRDEFARLMTRQYAVFTCNGINPNWLFDQRDYWSSEGYGTYTTAIHKALNQSVAPNPTGDSVIHVFPGWPKAWDAKYKLLAKGGFLVSSSIEQEEIQYVEIESQAGETCRVRSPWDSDVDVYRNGVKAETIAPVPVRDETSKYNGLITFDTVKDDIIVLVKTGDDPDNYRTSEVKTVYEHIINDDQSLIDYSETDGVSDWTYNDDSENSWIGDRHVATKNGAEVEFTFDGNGVEFITETGPDMGKVDVWINGKLIGTISCYSPTISYQHSAWEHKGFRFEYTASGEFNSYYGRNTIKLVKKSGDRMVLDGFKIHTVQKGPVYDPQAPISLDLDYLKDLLVKAKTVDTTDWSAKNLATLAKAIENAQALVDANSSDDGAIISAIKALQSAMAATPAVMMINNNDSVVSYTNIAGSTANWFYTNNRSGEGAYMNDAHICGNSSSGGIGNYCEVKFTGTGIAYLTERYSDMGNVDVYIDGVFQETVSCYKTGSRNAQYAVFTKQGLPPGEHTLRLVKASGQYMIVDAFKVWLPDEEDPYADLQELIAEAEALDKDDYTAATWAELASALSAAKDITEEDAKDDILAAHTALRIAMDALVEIDPFADLQALIAEAEELVETDYTAATWAELESALTAAKEITAEDDKDDIVAAYTTLRDAIDNLEGYIAVTSVKIDGAAIQQIRIRNTKQFAATVNPTNATDQSLTWESSNEKIFTVDEEGLVKGVGTGSAKLIVTCGGKTSFIMVQVTA